MSNSVLVTGAGGFIGLNVVKEYLRFGWKVYALVHRNIPEELKCLEGVELVVGDVTNEDFMMQFTNSVDVVTHVAGLASDVGSYDKFRRINFEPIKYLSKIPRKKLIYVSSSDVYGIKDFGINDSGADESFPLIEYPKNPYPHFKIMSENWLRENCELPYVIIRPGAVWGEGDKTLESRFVDFLRTSPFIIHFGKWNGKNRWPLANVSNVAKTIVSASIYDNFDYKAITIIDPKRTTIDDYYKNLAKKYFPQKKYLNLYLPLWIGKLIGFISTALSNILKLKQPIMDPTFYAVHHVSSNLDFKSDRMLEAISLLEKSEVSV